MDIDDPEVNLVHRINRLSKGAYLSDNRATHPIDEYFR